ALPLLTARVKKPLIFLHVGGEFTPAQKQLITDLKLGEMTRALPAVPHESLPTFYHAADLFVFPSWYEGFGMPLIEAMASGLPVVCSDYEVFHEVAGEAALFFPPFDPIGLTEVVEGILNSAELRQQLIKRGLERAGTFSWRSYATKVLEIYDRILRETV
ncbi:MAG: glycosyltransferase, partial [Thermoflexus sp.]